MLREIYLVRHAETLADPGRPPGAWDLTEAGHAVASSLRGVLPEIVFSSPEPKALQTARHLTRLPVNIVEEFGEHRADKGSWVSAEEFTLSVERYFSDRKSRVWGDSHTETSARFKAGLARVSTQLNGAACCTVVSHGRIMCSYLGDLTSTSGYEIWKILTMPTVIKLAVCDEAVQIETISFFH